MMPNYNNLNKNANKTNEQMQGPQADRVKPGPRPQAGGGPLLNKASRATAPAVPNYMTKFGQGMMQPKPLPYHMFGEYKIGEMYDDFSGSP